MKQIVGYPPNIDRIRTVLPVHEGVLFSYGGAIYNPQNVHIDGPLEAHEAVHAKQQGDKTEEWWNQYLEDPKFRYEQELEAYRTQYKEICKLVKDRNLRYKFLNAVARDLSSPLYGNCVTLLEAIKAIQ